MSLELEFSKEIDRPIEEVFDYVIEPENDEEWKPLVINAPPADEEMAVGTTWRLEIESIIGTTELENECIEFERPTRFGYRNEGSVATEGLYTFEEVEGRTLVTWTGTSTFKGLMRLAKPLVGRMMRNEIQNSMDELKSVLEETKSEPV